MTDPKIGKPIPEGVSPKVHDSVADIAAQGGNKKRIDSAAEYKALQDYLSGNRDKMNDAERNFIDEQMKEYEAKDAEDKRAAFMENVTDTAKNLVKMFAGMTGNKKEIDTVQEAEGLLAEIDNPKNDLNAYDKEYIRNVVAESGVLPSPTQKEETKSVDKKDDAAPETPESNIAEKIHESIIKAMEDSLEKLPPANGTPVNKTPATPSNGGKVNKKPPVNKKTPPAPQYTPDQEKTLNTLQGWVSILSSNGGGFFKMYQNVKDLQKNLLPIAKSMGLDTTDEYKTVNNLCSSFITSHKNDIDAAKADTLNEIHIFVREHTNKFNGKSKKLEDAELKTANDLLNKAAMFDLQKEYMYIRLNTLINNTTVNSQ